MSSDIAIKVENLSKCYLIYDAPRDRLKQFIVPRLQRAAGFSPKQYYREFWALRDVSFEVKKGETVGIIGRNGSGKSTLLQIICGTLNPTAGSVTTNGRIAALLELGSGFNPEFTGRENVYMSCALLGLTKEEIDNRFDDIAAFADIGDFIGQPVKTYSSGMFVRLAFAVNVVSSPDILVVDEALAVGDMNFQAKCMTALTRFQENGGTLLFVSHDTGAIKSLCRQGVYLERGQVVCQGPAPDVADQYMRVMREEMSKDSRIGAGSLSAFPTSAIPEPSRLISEITDDHQLLNPISSRDESVEVQFKTSEEFDQRVAGFRYGTGGALIRYVELLDMSDQPVLMAQFNQSVKIRIHFDVLQETELSVNYYIQDDKRNVLIGAGLRTIGLPLLQCAPGSRRIATYITKLPLQDGNYSIQVQLVKPIVVDESANFLDVIENAVVFNVERRPAARIWAKLYLDNEFILQDL